MHSTLSLCALLQMRRASWLNSKGFMGSVRIMKPYVLRFVRRIEKWNGKGWGHTRLTAWDESTAACGGLKPLSCQELELSELGNAGFQVAGRGQVVPAYDNAGRPIPRTKEWVLQVLSRHPTGYLTMVFHCPEGYPNSEGSDMYP